MTKGEKINRVLTVEQSGTSCVGNMNWETNFIQFKEGYRWQSESIDDRILFDLKDGTKIHVNAFAYEHKQYKVRTLRRVKVQIIS